ncbi:MAG: prepilin-type N-terminal cleavage/methylation domain-containing protein [Parcubacteria group bacterium]
MKMNFRKKEYFSRRGITLVELIISIFIFSIVLIGILTLSVSVMNSYHKASAAKMIKENAEYAFSLIAKDVRMGSIVSASVSEPGKELEVKRNRGGEVCYKFSDDNLKLSVCGSGCGSCSSDLIDLSGSFSHFSDNTGFYSKPTDADIAKDRGWAEINLNIVPDAGHEMEGDQINVQTIVSARDYGWEEL